MPIWLERGLYRLWVLRRAVILCATLPPLALWLTSLFDPMIERILPHIWLPILVFIAIAIETAMTMPVGYLKGLRLSLAFAVSVPLIVPVWTFARDSVPGWSHAGMLLLGVIVVAVYVLLGLFSRLLGRVPIPWAIHDRSQFRVDAPPYLVFDFEVPAPDRPILNRGIDSIRRDGDVTYYRFAGSDVEAPLRVESDRAAGTVMTALVSDSSGIAETMAVRIEAHGEGSRVTHHIRTTKMPISIGISIWLEDGYADMRRFLQDTLADRPGVSLKRTKINMIEQARGGEPIP